MPQSINAIIRVDIGGLKLCLGNRAYMTKEEKKI